MSRFIQWGQTDMRTFMKGQMIFIVVLAAAVVLILTGCTRQTGEVISANIRALHDTASSRFNGDCLNCHRDVMERATLDPKIKDVHVVMMPFVPGYVAAKGPTNESCQFCHEGVDFRDHSTAGVRNEVNLETCVQCHGPSGPGKKFTCSRP